MCRQIVYTVRIFHKSKLTKNQKWERTKASSSGQLKCCIHDFFKFSKFPKLLDESSLNLLQTIYIFQKIDNKYYIQHNGAISGSYSELSMTFNIKWKMIDMYIKLEIIMTMIYMIYCI